MKIEINRVCKSYHLSRHRQLSVLNNIDLTIESGSFTVILGESGCGKSTLLSMIAGLIKPSSGEILVDGLPVAGPSPARTLLFQQPSLLPWLTVAENIAFGCRLRGDKEKLTERVQVLIEMIGLTGFANNHPPQLSVGMAQRVSLARALISKPEALLLDEPFSSLDTFNRVNLQEQLTQIWQHKKYTTLLVTHDLDEAMAVGQKIILLGGCPCEIHAEYDIESPFPRKTSSPSLLEIRQKINFDMRQHHTRLCGSTPIKPMSAAGVL